MQRFEREKKVECHTDKWLRFIYSFLRHTGLFVLYKNNGSQDTEWGGEEPWRRFWTFHNWHYAFGYFSEHSHITLVSTPNVPWGCVTEAWAQMWPVAEVLNSELPHLVNEIQTQLLWLKHISIPEWLKIHHYWMYSCRITWNIFSRCIVRYPITLNNIMWARGICRTTFEKKIRISWVCQCIIKVLRAILSFKGNKNL